MDRHEVTPLITIPNPWAVTDRQSFLAGFQPGETLGMYVQRHGVALPRFDFDVWHNGRPVRRALWMRLIPRVGDQVIIRAKRPAGGGGGGGKVLRTVAMVALVVVSIYTGGVAAAAFGGYATTAGAIAGGLASAAVMIGGSMLINALLPPPMPTAAALGSGAKYETSPTYSISGGRNSPRPWEPMTLIFGRHKVVPDYGAKFYTEYVGDTQYLNQVFHFGLQAGSVVLSDFKIGQTSVDDYQDVQIQVSGEDGKLSMFPGNVDTLDGFVLESGVVNTRTTPMDVTAISVDLAAQLYSINDSGGMEYMSVALRLQYRAVGATDWITAVGGADAVYATHYWSLQEVYTAGMDDQGNPIQAQRQILYGSTNPSDHAAGDNVVISPRWCDENDICYPARLATWVWAPHPAALGQPWVGIAPDPLIGLGSSDSLVMYGARQEPTRRTVTWAVPRGQYEIRIWKVTGDVKSSRASNETAVAQIRATQADDADYTGQLRVAVRIKATSQLNGAIDEFSAIAEAHAPVWKGDHFDVEHTRNPGWWYLWFSRGKRIEGRGRIYGVGLGDDRCEIEGIKAWAAWCDLNRLTFDYVLDRKMNCAQTLQMIARAGRASTTWQSSRLGVVWDAADAPVTGMFGPFNIKAGTFKIAYINDDTPDEIVVTFANEDKDWQMDEVRATVPGATTTSNPLQLDLDGVTVADTAGREANLIAASQVWHRRRTTWESDFEGWHAMRGDVVRISHDLTVWDYSGRFMSLLSRSEELVPVTVGDEVAYKNLVTVRVSVTNSFPSPGGGIAMIRDPENNMRTVNLRTVSGDVDEIELSFYDDDFKLPGDPYYEGVPALDWGFFFGPLATPGRRFKIVDVQPSQDGVRFSAVDDDPEYYACEHNPYEYVPPRDGDLLAGIVFGITFVESIVNVLADISNVQIGWALSTAMPVDLVVSINGSAQPVVRVVDRKTSIQAQTGDVIDVTITPVSGQGRGRPSSARYVVLGLTAPLPAVTGLTSVFRDGLTVLTWARVVDARQPEYEVRLGDTWANSRTVAITPTLETLAVGNGLYFVAARYLYKGQVIYGPAASLLVSGAALVRNVLVTRAEQADWDGALSDGAYIWDGMLTLAAAGDLLASPDLLAEPDLLWLGGPVSDGVYTSAQTIDVGFVAAMRLDFLVHGYAYDVNEDLLSSPDLLASPDLLGSSSNQYWKAQPQYRVADDDGVYGPWIDYTPGLVNARFVQIRLVLHTNSPAIVPFIDRFEWSIDVPDLVQSAEGITVPSSGLRIEYEKVFHDIPNVQIALFNAIHGDRYVLSDSNETGFDIRIFNDGVAKAAMINWLAQGY